ncbi:MAG: alpha-amylase family glycosyl hydrolase [Chloroflexota bacterium]
MPTGTSGATRRARTDAATPRPPNNWQSFFGGSAWTWEPAREQFYMHTFLVQQPELNWRSPEVRDAQMAMIRGWLDRGVDGFRLDVFNAFFKAVDLPDNSTHPGPATVAGTRRLLPAGAPVRQGAARAARLAPRVPGGRGRAARADDRGRAV